MHKKTKKLNLENKEEINFTHQIFYDFMNHILQTNHGERSSNILNENWENSIKELLKIKLVNLHNHHTAHLFG